MKGPLHISRTWAGRTLLIVSAILYTLLPVTSMALEPPSGDTILTVSGNIDNTNAGADAVFDLPMLEVMATTRFSTSTIWTEGSREFTGVPLKALMAAVGADGELLKASAINDYSVEIPLSDAVDGGAIVAYLMDGKPMSVRDKGPLWVMYPFDQNPDYQTEIVYSRSIWQLDRLEVVD